MAVRRLDEQPFLNAAWFEDHRAFADTEDPVAVVAEVVGDAARVGLDMNSYCMPAKRFRDLERLLPGAEFVDFSDVLMPIRLRKSPAEIAVMRAAAAIADEAMRPSHRGRRAGGVVAQGRIGGVGRVRRAGGGLRAHRTDHGGLRMELHARQTLGRTARRGRRAAPGVGAQGARVLSPG